MKALYVAASGMAAQQTQLDTVAHNLANVSTTGFKRSRSAFEDLLYQQVSSGGKGEILGQAEVGGGVRLAGIERGSGRVRLAVKAIQDLSQCAEGCGGHDHHGQSPQSGKDQDNGQRRLKTREQSGDRLQYEPENNPDTGREADTNDKPDEQRSQQAGAMAFHQLPASCKSGVGTGACEKHHVK